MGSAASIIMVPGVGGRMVPVRTLGASDDAGAPCGSPCCQPDSGCSWVIGDQTMTLAGYIMYLIGCVVTGKLAQPDACQCGQPICPYARGQF